MQFSQCPICKLSLPLSVMEAIIVNHQGKRVRIFICERCKKIKEEEAQRRRNEVN